jgi:uncharacterized protein (DUF885 family)
LWPLNATANGHRQYNAQFTNTLSEEHREAHRRFCAGYLARLQEFDRAQLGSNGRLSYDVFKYGLERCLESLALDFHLMPIDQGGFALTATFPIWGSGKGAQPFRTVVDYDNFLKRIDGFVEWIDTAIANMRRGMARGLVQPRAAMESVLPQLAAMIVDDPKKSPFYEPIASFSDEVPAAERERIAKAYEAAIRTQIVPAYRRLHAFIRDDYLPKTRASAGLSGMPGGDKLYAYYIRANTTTSLTPAELQAIGRREMALALQKMEALKAASGFSGPLKEWAAKLYAQRTRYPTPDEIIGAYRALRERVDPQIGRLFGRLPRGDYDFRRVEPHREDGAPSQYWRAGPGRPALFYINMRTLSLGPTGISEALFLHETNPGHHLQISLARENTALPLFRRGGRYHAFVEGWASYAETLGFDLGLYKDPLQHLFFLNGEMSRAAALVVDPGLHARGWSREQAMQFYFDHTLASISDDAERGVRSGVERMMVWPAYSTGYKIGQLKMLELRARAEAKLGPRFDLRAFHDEVLKDGAMPLAILEEKIDRWIASLSQ